MGLGADGRIMRLHDRIVPERRDDARLMDGVEPRERCHVEMVVVTVADEHEVDLRQGLEGDPGPVHPLRTGEGDGGDPVDQTGSSRMFRPRVCRSTLAWPT